MKLIMTPMLRNALLLDAVATTLTTLLLIAGSGPLSQLLALPQPLLFWAGVVLVPFVTMLFVTARKDVIGRLLLVDIIALNLAWVIASFALLGSGMVAPNFLGTAFITAQALAVAGFAMLQIAASRSAPAHS